MNMIIVGELINASRKKVASLIESKDTEAIQKIARDQHESGANLIDVNAGVFVGKEPEYLKWLVTIVQEAADVPCCIDSPDPEAIEGALSVHKGAAMINSISLEKERYDALLPVVSGTDCKVVALCMSDAGMPRTADERVGIAEELINSLVKNNVPLDNIYVDPLVQPISTDGSFGVEFLDAIDSIMTRFKGVHTICGLSNISYGLPERKFLNRIFMVMAITKGLDGAIVDPLDKQMMAAIIAAEALAGKDDYCSGYLQAYRAKKFDF
jgi:5-methyltetrahydrofolate--homocysteine methyltransferase